MATTPTALTVAIAAEIRALMAKRGVTQNQLAAATGVSQSQLSRRLAQVPNKPFDVEVLDAAARYLGTTILEVVLAAQAEVGKTGGTVSDLRDRMRPSDTGLANAAYSSDDGVPPEQTDHDFDI